MDLRIEGPSIQGGRGLCRQNKTAERFGTNSTLRFALGACHEVGSCSRYPEKFEGSFFGGSHVF